METDKHYFFEGLFIIVFSISAAILAVWLGSPGFHDDILYSIHFPDSVSGVTVGDPVTFRGVDVGNVKSIGREASKKRAGQDRHQSQSRDERLHRRRYDRTQRRQPGSANLACGYAGWQDPQHSFGKDRPPDYARRVAKGDRKVLFDREPGQESRDECR